MRRFAKDVKPAWEARRRELRVGEFLVKKFRVPAGNQELVLSAFEEEGWPAYIDDPLPMKCEIAPKQRLHNVVTRLNGSQLVPILPFQGDGKPLMIIRSRESLTGIPVSCLGPLYLI